MLLLAVIPRTPHTEELLSSLYTNAGIAGFALLLTAIIQTGTNQLCLFEALFILHVLFFLGTGASPMGECSLSILFSPPFVLWLIHFLLMYVGKYHWTKGRVIMGVVVQFVSVITFTGWALYVWVNVEHFGNVKICNDHIKYVIFFATIRATAPWLRGIWIAGLVLSAVGLMLSFGWKAMELFEMKRMVEEQQAEESDSIAHREVAVTPGTQPHAETKKEWYFDISFTLLLCVAPLLPHVIRHSRIATQLGDICYDHARTHGECDRICHIPLGIH